MRKRGGMVGGVIGDGGSAVRVTKEKEKEEEEEEAL